MNSRQHHHVLKFTDLSKLVVCIKAPLTDWHAVHAELMGWDDDPMLQTTKIKRHW